MTVCRFMRFAKVKWISLNNHIIHLVNTGGIAFTLLNLGRQRQLPVHLENDFSSQESLSGWV